MASKSIKDKILDTALELAEVATWEKTHLYSIAESLNITLNQISKYYPQKDDLVEAWFDRADAAVLSISPAPEFLDLPKAERLHHVIMTWLGNLASYRRVTREMLYYKLEFGHIHLQVLGVLRISRTVQWFRESARIDTTGLRRILEEVATSGIYMATFARWLFDDSLDSEKTRDFLKTALTKNPLF